MQNTFQNLFSDFVDKFQTFSFNYEDKYTINNIKSKESL